VWSTVLNEAEHEEHVHAKEGHIQT
jgi:hypothetical protein